MSYFEERNIELYLKNEQTVAQYYYKLEKAFIRSKNEIQRTIESFYGRYAKENGLSYYESQMAINSAEIMELREFIEHSLNNIDNKYSKSLELASLRHRISRYEALQMQIDAMLTSLYSKDYEEASIDKLKHIYTNTYEMGRFNIDKLRGYGKSFSTIDENSLVKLIQYPFNGASFSSRIWKQKEHLQGAIMESLTTMLVQGSHPSKLSKELSDKFKTKRFDAYRLLHTESSYLTNRAIIDSYVDDGVKKYQILATLDSKTCSICGSKDNKIIELKESLAEDEKNIVGLDLPPFHPLCRCTTVPYDDEFIEDSETRVARDEKGEYIDAPSTMNYDEWKEKVIEKKNKSDKIPSEEDLNAIEYYVSGEGMHINNYLRGRYFEGMPPIQEEDKEYIKKLEKATDRTHNNKVLYRSVDASAVFGEISDFDFDHLREALVYNEGNKHHIAAKEKYLKNIDGKIITDKGFLSTTKSYDIAYDFNDFTGATHPIIVEFTNADKVKGFDLGKYMPELDKRMEQEEVILKNNTSYKIKSVKGKNGYIHVEAEFVQGDKSDLQPVNSDDTIKLKDDVMKDLADISEVKSNSDIKIFAEQLIDNLNIDRSNITISVKGITDHGYCDFDQSATQDIIHYKEYVLNSNDKRSMTHRLKTAFHESFHLSAEGMEWDGLDSSGRIKEIWRSLEETFTESSAHYMLKRYGVTEKIAPSYPKELVTNLPRLKQLQKYSSCNTIQDFGEIAFTDRQNGVSAKWVSLSKQMKKVKLADDYYKQYYEYIMNNEDDLFDMFLGNMPGLEQYRSSMKIDLKSAMNKDRILLNDNEQTVYYGILSCAMQKVGVK